MLIFIYAVSAGIKILNDLPEKCKIGTLTEADFVLYYG